MSEIEKIKLLVGESAELAAYLLAKSKNERCPGVLSLERSMEQTHFILQTAISKKHNEIKRLLDSSPNDKHLIFKKMLAEKLMKKWKFYYY